jgi:hypothetical protein
MDTLDRIRSAALPWVKGVHGMIKGILIPVAMVFVCLGAIIPNSSVAAETNNVPESFTATIGGFFGTSYGVELRDGSLFYSVTSGSQKSKTVTITPTTQQWQEFRRALDDVKIWQWRTNYPNPGVFDGTQWSLSIQYHARTLKTQGCNNYPGRTGKPNGSPHVTKEFSAYTAAITRLLGGKEFQ